MYLHFDEGMFSTDWLVIRYDDIAVLSSYHKLVLCQQVVHKALNNNTITDSTTRQLSQLLEGFHTHHYSLPAKNTFLNLLKELESIHIS